MPTAASPADLEAENRRLSALLRAAGIDPASGRPLDGSGRAAAKPEASTEDRLPAALSDASRLLDTISEGLYVVDTGGRTTMCNAAMVRLLGFASADEAIGKSLHEMIHHTRPDGRPYPVEDCPIYRAAREGVAMVVDDETFFRPDGTAFPVEYRTAPLMHDGRLIGAVCSFVDISARVEHDHRLRESEERLGLAMQAAGIGVWDYAPQTGLLRWDDRVRALFGLSAGRPVTIENNRAAIHPGDRTRVEQALADAFNPKGSGAYEVDFRTIGIEDGKLRWVEARGQASFVHGEPIRLLGVLRDISGRKEAELHHHLMVNELNHRVKNSLAMVQGLAAQTFRGSQTPAREVFMARVVALARAHDVLTQGNWQGADLREVVALALRAHDQEGPSRFDIDGPALYLSPKTVLAFSLALHELAANAVRFGALSAEDGRVTIRWETFETDGDQRFGFSWNETGGPHVEPPRRTGFGTKLIEKGFEAELQGTARIRFEPGGVVFTINAPLPPGVTGMSS